MELKIDPKFEEKLTCTFQNDMKNFHRLKNRDFILESRMAELNQIKFETTRSTRCSDKTSFYLENKWIAQLTKLLTRVLQNRCS